MCDEKMVVQLMQFDRAQTDEFILLRGEVRLGNGRISLQRLFLCSNPNEFLFRRDRAKSIVARFDTKFQSRSGFSGRRDDIRSKQSENPNQGRNSWKSSAGMPYACRDTIETPTGVKRPAHGAREEPTVRRFS